MVVYYFVCQIEVRLVGVLSGMVSGKVCWGLLHSIRTSVHSLTHTGEACRLGLITRNILPSCDVPDVHVPFLMCCTGLLSPRKQERQSIQPTAN